MKNVVSLFIGNETSILFPRGLLPNEHYQVAHAYICPKRAGYERVDQCFPHVPDWHYGGSLTLLWKEAPEVRCESAICERFDGSWPGCTPWEKPVDEDLERCTKWRALPVWGRPTYYVEVSYDVARQRNDYWGRERGVSEEKWSNLTWED